LNAINARNATTGTAKRHRTACIKPHDRDARAARLRQLRRTRT
jgi:hypothetical protein